MTEIIGPRQSSRMRHIKCVQVRTLVTASECPVSRATLGETRGFDRKQGPIRLGLYTFFTFVKLSNSTDDPASVRISEMDRILVLHWPACGIQFLPVFVLFSAADFGGVLSRACRLASERADGSQLRFLRLDEPAVCSSDVAVDDDRLYRRRHHSCRCSCTR